MGKAGKSFSSSSNLVPFGLLLLVFLGWGFYFLGVDAFLEAAYSGEAWSYFNELASRWRARQNDPSARQFLREARTLLFRLASLGTVFAVLLAAMWKARQTLFSSFFSEKTSPFNLALFRIAIFGILLSFDLESSHWYAQLPSTLQLPPTGLSPIATDPTLVSATSVIFRIACLCGLFGLFTRASAAVALFSGLYVLGIPQFYGKVNHFHHVLWFTALLVPSRCADVLSVDALFFSRSSPDVDSPAPSRAYALPLRYAWILLGIVYFFPGVWKFAGEGFAWAFSENLKYRMHSAWFVRSFIPPLRIDQYPVLYQSAGLFTILFEIGFVFTLPFRSLRPWAVGSAFFFHEATRLTLGIFFSKLYPILPFLLDIREGFKRLGGKLYERRLTLKYDSSERWQRTVVGSLRRMDLFDRLRAQERGENGEKETSLALVGTGMEENALWKDGRLRWGRLFHVVRFVPTALLLLPLVPFAKRSVPSFSGRLPEGSTRAVSLIGGVLIVANVLCGAAKINSYPFSVYPTFAVRADSTITTLQVKGIGESGRRIEVLGGAQDHEQAGFTSARFKGLFRSIRRIDEKEERAEKLHALWTVLQNRRSELKSITEVRFYQANYSTNPDRSSDRLLDRSLLTTIDVSSQSPATDSETD